MFKKLLSNFKNYNVYLEDIENNSKKLVKEFKKDFLAREYVREQLDYSLKLMSSDTKNEWTLVDDFLKQRKAKFIINNDDFDEDDYVKQKAPSIFNQQLSFYINKAFCLVKVEKDILVDIENCEVFEINRLNEDIEIVYKKKDKIVYLSIKPIYHMSSMHGLGMFFKIDNKLLENEKKSLSEKYTKNRCDILTDIKQIIKIFHLKNDRDPYYRIDFMEILYKDNNDTINSYRLGFIEDEEDEVRLDIKKYENIFSFKSNILDDKYKIQLDYSYDDKNFYPIYYKNDLTNDIDMHGELEPKIIRVKHGECDINIKPFKDLEKEVFFKITKEGITSDNLIYFEHCLLDIETFEYLSKEEKDRLIHFLSIMELFINDKSNKTDG